MDRRPLEKELRDIEIELRRLTLRVSEARQLEARRQSQPREPVVGDRVRIRIVGTGQVDGTVVGITKQRVKVRPNGTTDVVLRAPKNVVLITE
jgi:uncharacterized Fe-S cluster-containing radical SAM superfamily enzyme